MAIPKFSSQQIEQIARCISDARTHTQFSVHFTQLGIDAPSDGSKWLRIREGLAARQQQDGVGNNIGAFIQDVMAPVNFVGESDRYETLRTNLNRVLAFAGINLTANGKIGTVAPAATLAEAEARASELRVKLIQRAVHSEVLKFCKAELLDGNYFHAVLEATKSVAEILREKSGLDLDGSALVQKALSGDAPHIAINSLQTETERSEQKGFANLVIGLFGTFRNPTAHAPRLQWPMSERDALDLMTLVSYVHRRLESAVPTHLQKT